MSKLVKWMPSEAQSSTSDHGLTSHSILRVSSDRRKSAAFKKKNVYHFTKKKKWMEFRFFCCCLFAQETVNPYETGVLFMGHRQTK